MADSLREAAEAVIDQCAMLPVYANTPSSWTRGINRVWEQAAKLKAALSEPDPVAEAITLINRLNRGCYCRYDHRCGNCQAILDVQKWAERNG